MGPKLVLKLRVLAEVLQAGGEQASSRFLTGGEEEGRRPHDGGHLGRRTVRVRGERQIGQHVDSRFTAAVLDIGGEPVIEPGEGC